MKRLGLVALILVALDGLDYGLARLAVSVDASSAFLSPSGTHWVAAVTTAAFLFVRLASALALPLACVWIAARMKIQILSICSSVKRQSDSLPKL